MSAAGVIALANDVLASIMTVGEMAPAAGRRHHRAMQHLSHLSSIIDSLFTFAAAEVCAPCAAMSREGMKPNTVASGVSFHAAAYRRARRISGPT